MKQTIAQFNKETELIDKFLIILISLIPIFLSISIFVADFLASLSGLILLFVLLMLLYRLVLCSSNISILQEDNVSFLYLMCGD